MSLLSSLISNVMGQSASDTKPEAVPGCSTNSVESSVKDSSNSGLGHEEELGLNREPMEWKFIDFSKATRSPIFDVDPVMLKKFIGHNVTVLSVSRQKYQGCCLAIDPVSLSVILAKRTDDGKIRVITLPGYYLSKITVDANSVPAKNSVSVNDLDVAELYHAPSLYCETKPTDTSKNPEHSMVESKKTDDSGAVTSDRNLVTSNPTEYFSQEEIQRRKRKLTELLLKHRMPVTVIKDDVLEMPGGVKIRPPYTADCCDTSNKMIKKKINELIESL